MNLNRQPSSSRYSQKSSKNCLGQVRRQRTHLENISDTSRRVQGAIGENLLPAVKEAAAAIEGLLFSVEGNQGLKTATADSLAFATAMGIVSAGVLGVAAVIPLLVGLAGPIGHCCVGGVGALAGSVCHG